VIVLQYVSEKIGGAKGTELEDDIVEMEKVTLLFTSLHIIFSVSGEHLWLVLFDHRRKRTVSANIFMYSI